MAAINHLSIDWWLSLSLHPGIMDERSLAATPLSRSTDLGLDQSCIQGPESIQAVFPLLHEPPHVFSFSFWLFLVILLHHRSCVANHQAPAASPHRASLLSLSLCPLRSSRGLAALECAASREGGGQQRHRPTWARREDDTNRTNLSKGQAKCQVQDEASKGKKNNAKQ